jgi:hypothetical protein
MIYTINSSKYSVKHQCNILIIAPSRHKHPSSGANRPSVVTVTVIIDSGFNLSST